MLFKRALPFHVVEGKIRREMLDIFWREMMCCLLLRPVLTQNYWSIFLVDIPVRRPANID